MRIGYGEDIHKLVAGRDLVLGGVKIPFEKGLLGHSDADVVIHAICDALLGAAGKRDIGYYFSDKDSKWEGISSLIILEEVMKMISADGYIIKNIDASISCEKPHLSQYIDFMKDTLSKAMNISTNQLAIKAMTNEGLDAVGKGEAIRAIAVVLLEESK